MTCRHLQRVLGLLLILSVSTGCGANADRKPTGQVEGKVVCQNQDLKTGTVMFFPVDGGKHAVGMIGQDGNYSLSTYETGDGAILGKHKVVVLVSYENPDGSTVPDDVPRVPDKYLSKETTPLVVDVNGERNSILLDLE
ncbi:MAG: hypothetical protein NXI29_18840 [bacterium]|nr:hypothetical protein [bacterium]